MHLFRLLRALDDRVEPARCKIHLATWNGQEDPLDVYLQGGFDDWQAWQTRKNFGRDFVISLIELPRSGHWLFAGVHDSAGSAWVESRRLHRYDLRRRPATDELDGRLVVEFARPGRQAYLRAETWAEAMRVAEIRAERLRVSEFPGYARTLLRKAHLDIVVREEVASWKAALENVAGVYVIADRKTGKLYVGSATSGEGIWSRWKAYSKLGHGGNAELRDLLRAEGKEHALNFQFGVLEIADTHASREDVLAREAHWKDLLMTREHGLNGN